MTTPSILTLRPGAKLSQRDRKTLRDAGFVVIAVAPEDLKAIQATTILPANEMLRLALQTIHNATNHGDRDDLHADLAKRLIGAYLALGDATNA